MASSAPVGDQTSMRFALFGGVRAWRGAVELTLGPPRQRALLQLLLVASGEPVSLGEILTALWADEPAATATNQIHRHVGALRRRFEPELGRREIGRWLLPTSSGYRIAVDATTLDLLGFRDLLREAESVAETSPQSATAVIARALSVASVAPGDDSLRGMPRFVAVEEERVRAAIRAAEIALAAGRPGEVLPGLREIAGAHPFDEMLQARVVDCLTRSGRSADALALFDQTRTRLQDELGIDPGAALTQAQSNALAVPVRAESAAHVGSTAAPPPSQLPAPPPGFAGRQAVLTALHTTPGAEPRPVLITGMAGVGKTTFALRYAHELAPHFADGQLYVNLRGFDATAAPTDPLDALRDLLEGLGVPSQGQPESVAARSGLLRSILSDKQALIVLDNARDYHQIDPLLPGVGASKVIITSRNRMPGLTAFHHADAIQLEPFDDAEVLEFLRQRLPLSRVDDDRDAMIKLGHACGGLPLALAIIAARASTNPAFPLDLLVREFAQEPTPLDSLNAGSPDLDLSTVFSWSHRGLSDDAARTLVLLSAHPGPEISTSAATSMAGLDLRRTREALTELTLASVLRETRPGRYTLHDLVRDYALRMLADNGPDASARLVNHYLRSTRQAILTFGRPAVAPIDETMPGIEPERFATRIDAIKWYVKERHVLQAVCRLALRLGDHRAVLMLILDWRPMSQTHDPTRDLLPFTALALQAVEHVNEPILRAECYRDVAAKLARTGDRERARMYFDMAAETFIQFGDQVGLANVYRNKAANLVTDPKEAVDLLGKSVGIARELNNGAILVASLEGLAYALLRAGDSKAAFAAFSECLTIAIDEGLGDFELHARVGIVAALTASHEYEAATIEAEPALALLRGEPAPISELGLLMAYGDALMALRKDAQAIEVWQRFLALATPGLADDVTYLWACTTGDEVIAEVQAKLDTLTSVDQSILPH